MSVKKIKDAIKNNNIHQLNLLIPTVRNQDQRTECFHFAIEHGTFEAVACFLEHKQDPEAKCRNLTPLQLSATKGREGISKLLVEHGADIQTSLMPLIEKYDIASVQHFIQTFPETIANNHNLLDLFLHNAQNKISPLSSKYSTKTQESEASLISDVLSLIESIKNIQNESIKNAIFTYNKYSPMYRAIALGNIEIASAIMHTQGVQPQHCHTAIESSNFTIAKLLTSNPDDPNVLVWDSSNIGKTLLHRAIDKLESGIGEDRYNILVNLLDTTPDLDPNIVSIINQEKYTPIYLAVKKKLSNVVELLATRECLDIYTIKEVGAEPELIRTNLNQGFTDLHGHHITPLHLAIKNASEQRNINIHEYKKWLEIAKCLITEGAKRGTIDLDLKSEGLTPLITCISAGLNDVAAILVRSGANVAISSSLNGVEVSAIDLATTTNNMVLLPLLEAANAIQNNKLPNKNLDEIDATSLVGSRFLNSQHLLQQLIKNPESQHDDLAKSTQQSHELLDWLFAIKTTSDSVRAQIASIEADPYKLAFYTTLRWELTSAYNAAQVILTGHVPLVSESFGRNLSTLSSTLKTAGNVIPAFGIFVKMAGSIVAHIDENRRKQMFEHFQFASDALEMAGFAEAIARKLILSDLHFREKEAGILARINAEYREIFDHIDMENPTTRGKKDAKMVACMIISKILEQGSANPDHIAEITKWVVDEMGDSQLEMDEIDISNLPSLLPTALMATHNSSEQQPLLQADAREPSCCHSLRQCYDKTRHDLGLVGHNHNIDQLDGSH